MQNSSAVCDSRIRETPMAEAESRYQESRDIWNDYNATQKFEHELIHRKTTWWLSTQTILFAPTV
jgi:hypothetical protein